ncbi:hypothetical protein [Sneathiella glossodoripedis]|uniref:hypothetical protein n=1 Tax=Sneathiella glossodoripedis TaxID=418853 RepID=UPI000471CEAB|nr:hypothetical protein [Sneathiella glossodoripedis]
MLSPIKIILLLAVVAGVFLIARMVRGAVKKGGNPVDTATPMKKMRVLIPLKWKNAQIAGHMFPRLRIMLQALNIQTCHRLVDRKKTGHYVAPHLLLNKNAV